MIMQVTMDNQSDSCYIDLKVLLVHDFTQIYLPTDGDVYAVKFLCMK